MSCNVCGAAETSAESAASFILASASPRRRELLASAGLTFIVEPSQAPEVRQPGESAEMYVRRLARDKALEVATRRRAENDRRPVLAADTTVVIDGLVLEKPADAAEAQQMLESLSGRTHQVITGYCIVGPSDQEQVGAVCTEVRFKPLRAEEIQAYLLAGEWRDKAGAYAIQGLAAYMVEAIVGSYTNVVGLPLAESVEALRRAGVRPGRVG